jgi:hypothetical protein
MREPMQSIAIVTETAERGEHCPLTLYADSAGELAVVAEQDSRGYRLTNRFEDGVVGISKEDEAEADVDDSPACACCMTPVSRWDHHQATERTD